MLGIPSQGIDIIEKGLDQDFITWFEGDKLEILKILLVSLDPKLKLQFPIPAQSLKPFYQMLTSLFATISSHIFSNSNRQKQR